jgi:benzoyl-CoA reductase/2-hydroxyglutaryl-CoA dehydratase subunit BcrC/BadD/HgdB
MIEDFRALVNNRYKNAQLEKDKGRKIIGWTCNYIPEEIIYAAGMMPWRLLGGEERYAKADTYLYTSCCSFVKSCLADGLENNLDFLDGYVTGNTCDFIRRLYDVWSQYLVEKTPFVSMLTVPFKKTGPALNLYKKEVSKFKQDVESFFDEKITDESLREAIELYNETRVLLNKLYRIRKRDAVPLSGADVMDVVAAAMVSDRKQYNQILKRLLETIEDSETFYSDRIRLMVLGSALGDSNYLKIIEDLGGLVVIDDLCMGRRYFWDPVEDFEDPIEALARRYLMNAYCPRMAPYSDRVRLLEELSETFKIDGIIYETIKFCEAHGVRYPLYETVFKKLGVPVLKLDREHTLSGKGQMATRIQAFFESMGELDGSS